VLRAHPYIWVVSVLLTVVLMAAGVVGVLAAAQTETRHRKDSATGGLQRSKMLLLLVSAVVLSPHCG
jgi:type II secretory pathway component PulK